MKRALARTCLTAGLATGLAVAPAAASFGDPRSGDAPFELTCGNTTYMVVTNGNGEWTPAHDIDSNKVFVPHWFGVFHGEIHDAEGVLVDSFDDGPAEAQGSGKQKNDISCTFSFHEVSDGSDPEFPEGYTFDGSGSVTGQVSGKKG
jgi:hypothetical protein